MSDFYIQSLDESNYEQFIELAQKANDEIISFFQSINIFPKSSTFLLYHLINNEYESICTKLTDNAVNLNNEELSNFGIKLDYIGYVNLPKLVSILIQNSQDCSALVAFIVLKNVLEDYKTAENYQANKNTRRGFLNNLENYFVTFNLRVKQAFENEYYTELEQKMKSIKQQYDNFVNIVEKIVIFNGENEL